MNASVTPVEGGGGRRWGLTDLLLVGMAFIWGINYSVVKYGTQVVDPLAFNGARTLLASVALCVAFIFSRAPRLSRRDLLMLLLLGALGNGLYQYLFVEGIAHSRAGNAALMLAAAPAFVALIGRMRGVERVGTHGVIGIALSIAGIAVIVFSGSRVGVGESTMFGDLLLLAGCLTWALYNVLLKPYADRLDSVQLSAVTMVGGTIVLLMAAAPAMLNAPWGSLPPTGWGAMVYSGLGALVLAYFFWYRGVRLIGPTRTAMYGNLQPVVALLFAWAALGETPTIYHAVGTVLILGGLLLTRSQG